MSDSYQDFITRKSIIHLPTGIEKPVKAHKNLFPFQKDIVKWALRRGRASIFAGTGLGKTPMQCEYARHVEAFTGMPVLILAPLAVSIQTIAEALKTCSAVGRGESKFVTWDITKKAMRISASNDRDSEMNVSLDCAASAAGKIGVPSLQLATALEMMEANEKGEIQLVHYSTPSSLLIRQASKIAFVALAKT